MIDILFCAWNRIEFTRKSFETMLANTDWRRVGRLVVYDDGSIDGTLEYLRGVVGKCPAPYVLNATVGLGPVGVMQDYLNRARSDGAASPIFCKLDNDVMLPPGWLEECLRLMENNPPVDLLGIEARIDAEKASVCGPRTVYDAEFIGGIGLMRRRAFENAVPEPDGKRSRFGFGAWQQKNPQAKKAWISPPLPVCLLNLVPFNPWRSLSEKYIAQGWQRDWPAPYSEDRTDLWSWWA